MPDAPKPLTLEPCPKEWRCFYCDEVFTSEVDARNHFGTEMAFAIPACAIKAEGEFALLNALRNAEDRLASRQSDDSDVMRAMYSMQADRSRALREEEQKGYDRGLRDGRAEVTASRAALAASPAPAEQPPSMIAVPRSLAMRFVDHTRPDYVGAPVKGRHWQCYVTADDIAALRALTASTAAAGEKDARAATAALKAGETT